MKQTERILTFDLAKFIAIFFVLWGHIIQYLRHGMCYETPAYQVIYSFHMPLFIVIVGFFGTTCMRDGFRKLLYKKTRQLILPGISISLIICVIMKYKTLGGVLDTLIYSLWFLKAAFLCFLMYAISFTSRKFHNWIVFATLVISQTIFYSQFNLMYPCFLFGMLINSFWNLIKDHATLIALISGLLFIIMLSFWDDSFWRIPSGGVYPLHNMEQLINFSWQFYYRLFIGLLGSLFIITTSEWLCRKLPASKSISRMSRIGQNTLGIYLIQTVIIELLLWRWFNFDNIDSWIFQLIVAPLFSLVVMTTCLVCIQIIRKSKYAALIFLGEHKCADCPT